MANTQNSFIRLASLVEESIVDGPGLRFVLFTQGCPHRCVGCHNPDTHLPIGGTLVSPEEIVAHYQRQNCRGITFSGGEPFSQAGPLAQVARAIHELGGDVVTYTGYYLEVLQTLGNEDAGILELLQETDLLIDGPFVLEKRSLESPFVGSTNQRLIALSPAGNRLLEDIPVLPHGPGIKRIKFSLS
jgi:anaerobic ribonucleoside-triphosphate reductase activating protein